MRVTMSPTQGGPTVFLGQPSNASQLQHFKEDVELEQGRYSFHVDIPGCYESWLNAICQICETIKSLIYDFLFGFCSSKL